MRTASLTWGVSLAVAGAVLITTMATPSAQRRGRGDNASIGVPTATSTIVQDPEEYYGKMVTVSATVDQVLSKTAFVLDQRRAVGHKEVKAIGKPVLVIAPDLLRTVGQKQALMVRGQVVKFDLAGLAKVAPGYTLDLSPEVAATFVGQPVLFAASVIDSVYAELAKKPIPAPTRDEVSMSAAMKTISAAFAELRTAAQESKMDTVTQSVAKLQPAFTQTEVIWDNLGQGPAAEWAREARAHTASLEKAAAAGNWDVAKTSVTAINATCASCHGAYRERMEDGTFRFKAGSF